MGRRGVRPRRGARKSRAAVLHAADPRRLPPRRARRDGLHDRRVPRADAGRDPARHATGDDAAVPALAVRRSQASVAVAGRFLLAAPKATTEVTELAEVLDAAPRSEERRAGKEC